VVAKPRRSASIHGSHKTARLKAVGRSLYDFMNCIDRHVWDVVWLTADGNQLHHLLDRVHTHNEVDFATILQPHFSEKARHRVHNNSIEPTPSNGPPGSTKHTPNCAVALPGAKARRRFAARCATLQNSWSRQKKKSGAPAPHTFPSKAILHLPRA
jgi:hypothetical protein